MVWHPEVCQSHSCILCFSITSFSTWLSNWTWNVCAVINCSTLIKHNIFSCTSVSICKVLLYGIIEHHQLVLSNNSSLPQEFRYRCILYLGIIYQAQILVLPNISQQVYQTLKVYFTRI